MTSLSNLLFVNFIFLYIIYEKKKTKTQTTKRDQKYNFIKCDEIY
jgi:hypothetical protein